MWPRVVGEVSRSFGRTHREIVECLLSSWPLSIHRNNQASTASSKVNCGSFIICPRKMLYLTIPPTSADRLVANAAARYTNPLIQNCARAATWVADEHVLGAITAAGW